jgi:hypothetical protein
MIWVEPASDGDGAVNRRSSTGEGAASVSGSAVGSSPATGCTFSSGPDGFDI